MENKKIRNRTENLQNQLKAYFFPPKPNAAPSHDKPPRTPNNATNQLNCGTADATCGTAQSPENRTNSADNNGATLFRLIFHTPFGLYLLLYYWSPLYKNTILRQ